MQVKNWIPAFAGMTAMLGLAACEGIGKGSTLQSLEVRPATGVTVTAGSSYKLHECIRDQLVVIGTFTDGTTADFSFRAAWTSSDPAQVEVSNGEIMNSFISSGTFTTNTGFALRPGTVIPHATTSGPVTITAEFLDIRASLNVEVGTPSLLISPAPDTTLTPAQPTLLGAGTVQRFNLVVTRDGQHDLASSLNQLGPINALLWRFTPGPNVAFDARDTEDPADFDKYTISNGTDIVANINVLSGTVTGVKADPGAYPIEAHLSLCSSIGGTAPADPVFTTANAALKPTALVSVANFATNPLVLAREADFNGPGVSNGDIVLDTHQFLSVSAGLDTDGNLATAEFLQNLTNQVRYNLEPKDTACDDRSLNCQTNNDFLFSGFSSQLRTVSGSTGGQAQADACFPFCIPTLASLVADNTNPAINSQVTLTAAAINPTPGLITGAVTYTFDFGDGAVAGPQASPTAMHTYVADGQYTATVRVTDATGAVSQNAGAAQIRVGAAPVGNTAPTAVLTATPTTGDAPLSVQFNASGSSDPNTGDSVKVYEFDFGDGTVIRQSGPVISHVYLAAGALSPTVRVTDMSGVSSVTTAQAAVTVTGSATLIPRSNVLTFNAIPATLTAVNICVLPDLACTTPASVSEPAFTYPGQQFEAIGSFTATADCITTPSACFSGGVSTAIQKVTRLTNWTTRPSADSTEFSDIAIVRDFSDDFLRTGQVDYLKNVPAGPGTNVSIIASAPVGLTFSGTIPPATLTVTNCATCPP